MFKFLYPLTLMSGNPLRYPALALPLLFLLGGCSQPKNTLEKVKEQGYITVLTRNVATSYY